MTAIEKTPQVLPKVAIIGTGISGLAAAHYLHKCADLTLFEADSRIGGHTATIDVEHNGERLAVDTGFIVFNDWTYPLFKKLLDDLAVAYQPSFMGFSVSCDKTGLEYSGDNFNTLFAQRRRIVQPNYWRFLLDIVRFNKRALAALAAGELDDNVTLGDFLARENFSGQFISHYLVPMTSAIWSKSSQESLDMPVKFFVSFFKNHGLLSVNDRPTWQVICGGSRAYLEPLSKPFAHRIRKSCPVTSVKRTDREVLLSVNGQLERFDEVIFACHSNQAALMLVDASAAEAAVLKAIPYQENQVVLHCDESLLPKNRCCWSSWNYRITDTSDEHYRQERAVLTYNMNILQGLQSKTTYCVTLNQTDAIKPSKIIGEYRYAHPTFSRQSVAAQNRWHEINGVNRSWFCGAWWGNGFHEDGVASAKKVAEAFIARKPMLATGTLLQPMAR